MQRTAAWFAVALCAAVLFTAVAGAQGPLSSPIFVTRYWGKATHLRERRRGARAREFGWRSSIEAVVLDLPLASRTSSYLGWRPYRHIVHSSRPCWN